MGNENVELVLSLVFKNIEERKENYIIGIDGYSCAGKTSITEQLVKHFKEKYPVQVFHKQQIPCELFKTIFKESYE